jgi:hypothetical protein
MCVLIKGKTEGEVDRSAIALNCIWVALHRTRL